MTIITDETIRQRVYDVLGYMPYDGGERQILILRGGLCWMVKKFPEKQFAFPSDLTHQTPSDTSNTGQ